MSLITLLFGSPASADRPAVGARAPAFSAAATNGTTVRLEDFKGRRGVVLGFFPKAFTFG